MKAVTAAKQRVDDRIIAAAVLAGSGVVAYVLHGVHTLAIWKKWN